MQAQTCRIGIDARLAGYQHAGIGRYIESLIQRLPGLTDDVQWVYFFHDQDQVTSIFPSGLPPHTEVVILPVRHYSVREQVEAPHAFFAAHLDLLHVPHFNLPIFYRGRVVITIHDLLWHQYQGEDMTTLPAWQYWLKHQVYFVVVAHAIARAKRIFVPAETIQKTVAQYYPFAQQKILITREGIADAYWHHPQTPRSHAQQLVYVGSLYPHKNVRLVIDALTNLPNYTLALVGTRTVFQETIRSYVATKNLTERVHFLGYLRDDELVELYQKSAALIQPSFSEGFGLTGVEAMAADIPVLASSIPIFHEVYRGAALYFDPHSVESFCTAVQTLEMIDRQKIIAGGEAVARRYNWDIMAQETLAAYRKAVQP